MDTLCGKCKTMMTDSAYGPGGLLAECVEAPGHESCVRAAITAGADVNRRQANNRTLLMQAAECGVDIYVHILIEAGADVNSADTSGDTALIIAARNGHAALVSSLIEAGADVNVVATVNKYTALGAAAWSGKNQIVEILLKAGADVNISGPSKQTPLMWAAKGGKTGCTGLLINAGAEINALTDLKDSALTMAALRGHAGCLDQLICAGADVNNKLENGDTSLLIVAENCDREVTPRRLHHHLPDEESEHLEHEYFDRCVEVLTQNGADVNIANPDGKTPLWFAAEGGSVRGVEVLLNSGADISTRDAASGDPILLTAAQNSNDCYECVELLISKGADVNETGNDGFTALMSAAIEGNLRCIKLFVNKGADVNTTDSEGRTALMCAAENGRDESLKYLIDQGADVNRIWKDEPGYAWHFTALMRAALYGHNDCVNRLIHTGADVNRITPEGATALFYAAVGDQPHTVRLLLRSGAQINLPTDVAENTLQYYIAHTVLHEHIDEEENRQKMKDICLLLFVAGEILRGARVIGRNPDESAIWEKNVPEYLLHPDERLNLKHICREAIRKQMIHADPLSHLFHRIPLLRMPASIHDILLYGLSLDGNAGDTDFGGGIPFVYKLAARSSVGTPREKIRFRAGGGNGSTWYL